MENSLINSTSESTASSSKVLFKKPSGFYQAFEVSMEESLTVPQSNKSDLGMEISPSGANDEVRPFRNSQKSLQQSFNVSFGESLSHNESERSVALTKRHQLFTNQNKSFNDFFNVSYNETNTQLEISRSMDIDESFTTGKVNPFKKKKDSQNEIIMMESSMQVLGEKEYAESDIEEGSQKPSSSSNASVDGDEADSTAFVTKPLLFRKSEMQNNNSIDQLQITVTEESKTNEELENKNVTVSNAEMNETSNLTTYESRLNPFRQKQSGENFNMSVSITEERSVRSLENAMLDDSKQTPKDINLDKSTSKLTNKTTSYLEESSINDDNLNNWMSDQSEEEMPPTIPSITANLSCTKEKEAFSNTSTVETEPLSVWEQKFNSIVSNAEKKTQALEHKITSYKKSKASNKLNVNVEKAVQSKEHVMNKYKPPKLLKPAPFANKRLYAYVIKKLEPKYGIDTVIEAENLVSSICDTVKIVIRRKTHQKRLIQSLKKEMAEAGLIETTMDFYEFIIKFLPYSFRIKVVPCLQPVTNMVYPPKDVANPFDKIL